MSDLISRIKESIVNSNQLFEKSNNIANFCKKYQGKDYDDFSFKIEDSFEFELISNENFSDYDIIYEKFDGEIEDSVYSNVIRNEVKNITFDESLLNLYLYLNVKRKFKLKVNFDSLIGYSSEKDSFQLRKISNKASDFKNIILLDIPLENSIKIIDSDQTLIGYVNSKEEALLVIGKLQDLQNHCKDLQSKIKIDLHDLFFNISWHYGKFKSTNDISFNDLELQLQTILKNDQIKLPDIENWSKVSFAKVMIEAWLDLNCRPEIRQLVSYNTYNIYFSNSEHDRWLVLQDFLSEDNGFTII